MDQFGAYTYKNIDKIEEVQIQATKMIPDLKNKSYPECLEALNLPTLTYRRLCGNMIGLYKILHRKYHKKCCPTPKFVTLEEISGRTGRHSLYLYQE